MQRAIAVAAAVSATVVLAAERGLQWWREAGSIAKLQHNGALA
jgi:hypothetical protein